MSIPTPWTVAEEIAEDRSVFDSRPDIGPESGLLARLMRYFMGNPVSQVNVANASTTVLALLPDEPRARTAVVTVLAHSATFRIDGTLPTNANDPQQPVGTILTLMGRDTIKGFTFIAGPNGATTLSVQFYD